MRTNEFTFKKTKRVKTVTEHAGLSVDLTKEEAAALLELVLLGSETDESDDGPDDVWTTMYNLAQALRKFIGPDETKRVEAAVAGESCPNARRTAVKGDLIYYVGPDEFATKTHTKATPWKILSSPDIFSASGNWRHADTDELVTA
jgi:hypothetical protein